MLISSVLSYSLNFVGAVRRLNYESGTTFLETVTESNNVDSVKFELTETPFPCDSMFAYMNTKAGSDGMTLFTVRIDYKMTGGEDPGKIGVVIDKLVKGMAANGKELVESTAGFSSASSTVEGK